MNDPHGNIGECWNCTNSGYWIQPDPYDLISDSPIFSGHYMCLEHYNQRVIAALTYVQKHYTKN